MKARPGTKAYTIKLAPEEWEALAKLAEEGGFLWGGVPNRSELVRWWIQREADRSDLKPER